MLLDLDQFDPLLPGAPATPNLQMRTERRVSVPGGGEYWLCALFEPLKLNASDLPRQIQHVIVSPHFEGDTIEGAPYGGKAVNLAYLTNPDALSAGKIGAADVHMACIAAAAAIPDLAQTPAQSPCADTSLIARLKSKVGL